MNNTINQIVKLFARKNSFFKPSCQLLLKDEDDNLFSPTVEEWEYIKSQNGWIFYGVREFNGQNYFESEFCLLDEVDAAI